MTHVQGLFMNTLFTYPNWGSASVIIIYTITRARVLRHNDTCRGLVFEISAVFFISRSTMPCVSSVLFIIRSDKKEAFHVSGYSRSEMELFANWENIFSVSTLQQPIRLKYHELSSPKKRLMSFWAIRQFNNIHAEFSSFGSHEEMFVDKWFVSGLFIRIVRNYRKVPFSYRKMFGWNIWLQMLLNGDQFFDV